MGPRHACNMLAALVLAGAATWCRFLAAEEPASQSPPLAAASAPMKSSHQDLAERLRKLEAINQSIINRLDQSERERRRSEERYRSLEAKYEDLRKRLEQNPDMPLPADPAAMTDHEGRDTAPEGTAEEAP